MELNLDNPNLSIGDIRDYRKQICNTLIIAEKDSFVLFQYGPKLVKEELNYFLENFNLISNDTLKFMVIASYIIQIPDRMDITKYIYYKKEIMKYVKYAATFFDKEMILTIDSIAKESLAIINNAATKTLSVESAITQCAPIVQYGPRVLRKTNDPGFNYKSVPERFLMNDASKIDDMIKKLLVNYVDYIILSCDNFLSKEISINEFITKSQNELYNVRTYFYLVFLRYIVPEKDFDEAVQASYKLDLLIEKYKETDQFDTVVAIQIASVLNMASV